MDGLHDENARFQVEYIKEPTDVDEAVYHVVNFIQTRKRDKGNEFYSDKKIKKMAQRAARNEIGSSENEETYLSGDESEMKERVYRVPIKIDSLKNQNIAQSSGNKGNQNKEVKSEKPNVETPNDNKDYQKLVEKIEKLEFELRQGLQRMYHNKKFTNQGKGTKQGHFARDCPLRINKTRVQTHVLETKNGTSKYPQRPAGGVRNQNIHAAGRCSSRHSSNACVFYNFAI
ncbi:hypothetical protein ACJMK2_012516 [Sinanodonta woodiana]|uniref:Uncharacterized protein n=1 Tax=Sinanodonta woodiana TaxID=1069815 RepID=A0ABD3VBH5_SINWO